MAVFEDESEFIFTVDGKQIGTHKGIIKTEELVDKPFGGTFHTHTGQKFVALRPRFVDEIYHMKRKTQIVYPKDMGFILLMLDVKEGDKVIDAGVGSGAMCAALARAVGSCGKVFAYEKREEFLKLAEENLRKWGLLDRVVLKLKDISEGFDEVVDAIFLDVPDPWNYIRQCYDSLIGSGNLAIVCPTTNQVQQVVDELQKNGFFQIEIWESLFRQYKTNPERLRPFDRMVAHTAYMIFARKKYFKEV
ncbi:tRNA (adenine-N(1)-)-methyltransferase [Pseudothermotoga thermarum DSM 5069]|uniref:tRNA (adenine(58)-N(1))-methyltransferase TrmI n=2 Tax=Pseudothermotoga thermarum TaxID=119394 RepID=F7YYF2_9THEM|nr:tRNA (adenine-N(1)-)-methyltransferase [Pseudothermotoga thermarum DSM 5069]